MPGSLIVLGGGPVGVRAGPGVRDARRRRDAARARAADPGARGAVRRRAGGGRPARPRALTVLTDVQAESVARGDDGRVTRDDLDGAATLEADEILVGVGAAAPDRGPRAGGGRAGRLGQADRGRRRPARRRATTGCTCVGDANGKALLTHKGKYQARAAADQICGDATRALRDAARPPRVTFTEPQVAAVGHTLRQRARPGSSVRAVDVATDGTAGGELPRQGRRRARRGSSSTRTAA